VDPKDAKASLEEQRANLRQKLGPNPAAAWEQFPGRIAVVLSGGGARGAYEAGVLLAFQDARLPTHLLTASSIGSINAAAYAAHAGGYVGDAEPVVKAWRDVTPTAVGIDWSRYVFVLAGLIAASAGLGNLAYLWLGGQGIYFHSSNPKLTWFVLFLAGLAVMFFYDHISYGFYVVVKLLRGYRWKPDSWKLASSLLANLMVWGFAWIFFRFAHLHLSPTKTFHLSPESEALLAAGLLLLFVLWLFLRTRLSLLSHQFLRLPLRSGLFANFERTRFLRARIPEDALRASPIRVVVTAADIRTGNEKLFANCSPDELARDPGVDPLFARCEVESPSDLLKAVIASSAFPMAYELVEMEGARWTDGGIVSNQPIRPAIRLGADVLFLVLVEPAGSRRGQTKTFLDVGLRTIDVLMSQNLKTDLKLLDNVNYVCEQSARELGVRPEQVCLEIGGRTYRYIKAFTIRPENALEASLLDFDGSIVEPLIAQGYGDGARAVLQFREYLSQVSTASPRYVMRLRAEELRSRAGSEPSVRQQP